MGGLPPLAPPSWLAPRDASRPLDALDQDSDCSDSRTAPSTAAG
jgi:hypothetical protein